jgi:hypothetical protein
MVHCGYEATAVNDTLSHPVKAMMAAMRGPKTDGPMAPEIALDKARPAEFVFERQLRHNMDKLTTEKEASAKTSSECRSSAA